jgi:hypothetical protein
MKGHGWLVAGMIMAASMVCSGAEKRLTVVLLNAVGLRQADADTAVELGRRFFRSVGVESNWTVCRSIESCTMPPKGTFVRVSLVDWTKGKTLGFANMQASAGGSPQVYVFHPRVCHLASRTKNPLARVIARVTVHEILHSLGLEHVPLGIMRETVGGDELTNFGRGPAMPSNQVNQLRSGLSQLQPVLVAAAR